MNQVFTFPRLGVFLGVAALLLRALLVGVLLLDELFESSDSASEVSFFLLYRIT